MPLYDFVATTLRIAEIFSSIQGEGQWVGIPSTFIRVSGCNLRCIWCDTPYASWNPEGPIQSLEDILVQVEQAGNRHVVLTGGEPMLFEPVIDLCCQLHKRNSTITIETAGTIFRELPCDLMSISPKLSNSMNAALVPPAMQEAGWPERHEATRTNLDPLRQLVQRYPFQLKFVVNPEQNLSLQMEEIDDLLAAIEYEETFGPVILMPEGTDSEVLTRRSLLLLPTCMERGWRLGMRWHIDLFGNTKGT